MTSDPRSSATSLGPSHVRGTDRGTGQPSGRALRTAHIARRAFSLPAREFFEFLAAHLHLLRARWLLQFRPKGALLRTAHSTPSGNGKGRPEELTRLVLALNRAAEYGFFRPTCLVRAVALERMLAASGVGGAVVRVGVFPQGRELLAHAWIELNGTVLGDDAARVRRFTPLTDFSALPR